MAESVKIPVPDGVIKRRGLDKWVLSLFNAGKTTRQIEEVINANLPAGQEPISQPTISRFLKPFREAQDDEKRSLVNKTFHEDLATLNLLISRNSAIAMGIAWNERENCPMLNPDGSYQRRSEKSSVQIQASRVAISAILEKFKHLDPNQRQLYTSGDDESTTDVEKLDDDQLDALIRNMLQRVGGTSIAA